MVFCGRMIYTVGVAKGDAGSKGARVCTCKLVAIITTVSQPGNAAPAEPDLNDAGSPPNETRGRTYLRIRHMPIQVLD